MSEAPSGLQDDIALFRAILKYRPIGKERHFAAINIADSMSQSLNRTVTVSDVWAKLGEYYNLEVIEEVQVELDEEAEEERKAEGEPSPAFSLEPLIEADVSVRDDLAKRRQADAESPASPPVSAKAGKRKRGQSEQSSDLSAADEASGDEEGDEDDGAGEEEDDKPKGRGRKPSGGTSKAKGKGRGAPATSKGGRKARKVRH